MNKNEVFSRVRSSRWASRAFSPSRPVTLANFNKSSSETSSPESHDSRRGPKRQEAAVESLTPDPARQGCAKHRVNSHSRINSEKPQVHLKIPVAVRDHPVVFHVMWANPAGAAAAEQEGVGVSDAPSARPPRLPLPAWLPHPTG